MDNVAERPEADPADRRTEGSGSGSTGSVQLEGVTKKFGGFQAVDNIDLEIASG